MKIIYMCLIFAFIQLVKSAPTNKPVSLSFDQCPEFPSYFALLYSTMTGQIDNISSLQIRPPTNPKLFFTCLFNKFGIYNADKSINFDKYKNLMLETGRITGYSRENLERYLSSTEHCYSKKGTNEFETFGIVSECVSKINFTPE